MDGVIVQFRLPGKHPVNIFFGVEVSKTSYTVGISKRVHKILPRIEDEELDTALQKLKHNFKDCYKGIEERDTWATVTHGEMFKSDWDQELFHVYIKIED